MTSHMRGVMEMQFEKLPLRSLECAMPGPSEAINGVDKCLLNIAAGYVT